VKQFRRPVRPVIPGEMCPAVRNNSSTDPAVTITETSTRWRKGTRTCGRCGLESVPVSQSWGEHHTAWYYDTHTAPL
jgi:hypothetical protein